MSIHRPRRGSRRSWVLIWVLLAFNVAAAATGVFGFVPTP